MIRGLLTTNAIIVVILADFKAWFWSFPMVNYWRSDIGAALSGALTRLQF